MESGLKISEQGKFGIRYNLKDRNKSKSEIAGKKYGSSSSVHGKCERNPQHTAWRKQCCADTIISMLIPIYLQITNMIPIPIYWYQFSYRFWNHCISREIGEFLRFFRVTLYIPVIWLGYV